MLKYATQYKNILKKEIDNYEFSELEMKILNLSDDFNLKNPVEIMNFIRENPKFIDFFNDIKPLLNKYYPLKEYSLEYIQDFEYPDFEQLFLKMKSDLNDIDKKIEIWDEFSHKIRIFADKYDLWNKIVTDVM